MFAKKYPLAPAGTRRGTSRQTFPRGAWEPGGQGRGTKGDVRPGPLFGTSQPAACADSSPAIVAFLLPPPAGLSPRRLAEERRPGLRSAPFNKLVRRPFERPPGRGTPKHRGLDLLGQGEVLVGNPPGRV